MEVKKDKSAELKKMEEIVKELGIDSRMNPGRLVGSQIKICLNLKSSDF